jgi:hypothetical protein
MSGWTTHRGAHLTWPWELEQSCRVQVIQQYDRHVFTTLCTTASSHVRSSNLARAKHLRHCSNKRQQKARTSHMCQNWVLRALHPPSRFDHVSGGTQKCPGMMLELAQSRPCHCLWKSPPLPTPQMTAQQGITAQNVRMPMLKIWRGSQPKMRCRAPLQENKESSNMQLMNVLHLTCNTKSRTCSNNAPHFLSSTHQELCQAQHG